MVTPSDMPAADASAAERSAAPRPAEPRAPRRSSELPKRPDRLLAWLVLVGCLAVAAVPLSVSLFQPDVVHGDEVAALARSTETWRKQAELSYDEWSLEPWVPFRDEQPQYHTPPGATWIHLLAFQTLDPATADLDDLIAHSRVASVVCTLLIVAAVFWAAMSIGGLVPATLAGLVVAAMPMLLFHGRLAGDDIPQVAMVMLAMAAALWALRPMRPAGNLVRQGLGWALCGLLLGMATLTGGLPAACAVLLPLTLVLILCPNRIGHVLGLVAAVLIAALLTMPWALYVHEQDPRMWRAWVAALAPAEGVAWPTMAATAGGRLGIVLLATLPWTAWLIAALVQPFSTSSAGLRSRMFIGWVWFVSVLLLVLLLPENGRLNPVLLALPPAALVVAQVIRQFRELAAEGRYPRIWNWLCWPQALALLAASLLIPAAMHFQPWLVTEGWLAKPVAAAMHPLYWLGVAGALTLLVAMSMRYVHRHYPGKATACWALWTLLTFAAVMPPLTHGPTMRDDLAGDGRLIKRLANRAPVYHLPGNGESADRLPAVLRLYAAHHLEPATREQVQQAQARAEGFFVLAPAYSPAMAGFEAAGRLPAAGWVLWRAVADRPPTTPQAGGAEPVHAGLNDR